MSEEKNKKALITKMGDTDNTGARAATDAMRAMGWLADGSLRGAKLAGANLHRADLRRADLREVDLSGADLRWAELDWANLHRANLSRANLSGADLSGADLNLADLTDANLSEADLSKAILREANLRMANLKLANIYWADLRQANLSGTDLAGARCWATSFADVDLSAVKGLETILHYGPSTVGVDTLSKSKGEIPEVFLRGCGVPAAVIAMWIPTLFGETDDFYSCFISYSHQDKTFALRVYETLQDNGIRCWLDEKEILPGDPWREEIYKGISLWDKMLVCCSVNSLRDSQWVDKEVQIALEKEEQIATQRKQAGQPYKRILALLPLDLDGYLFDDACQGATPTELRGRQAARFCGWERDNAIFEEQIELVIRALRIEGGRQPPPKQRL